MTNFEINVLATVLTIVILIAIKLFANSFLRKFSNKFNFTLGRKKTISKFFNILLYLLLVVTMAIIWNIDREAFFLYLSSVLAVLGIAFFAQWSILSNITAGIILFFNHPMKIGDRILIHDKDHPIEGQIQDITGFFIYIKTDRKEVISFPNSIVLQHGISIREREAT